MRDGIHLKISKNMEKHFPSEVSICANVVRLYVARLLRATSSIKLAELNNSRTEIAFNTPQHQQNHQLTFDPPNTDHKTQDRTNPEYSSHTNKMVFYECVLSTKHTTRTLLWLERITTGCP